MMITDGTKALYDGSKATFSSLNQNPTRTVSAISFLSAHFILDWSLQNSTLISLGIYGFLKTYEIFSTDEKTFQEVADNIKEISRLSKEQSDLQKLNNISFSLCYDNQSTNFEKLNSIEPKEPSPLIERILEDIAQIKKEQEQLKKNYDKLTKKFERINKEKINQENQIKEKFKIICKLSKKNNLLFFAFIKETSLSTKSRELFMIIKQIGQKQITEKVLIENLTEISESNAALTRKTNDHLLKLSEILNT